jgi:flavin-binding protein dodecin
MSASTPRIVTKGARMSVAKVTEISATSKTSFEDCIQQGMARAHKSLRNVRSMWIKEQQVRCDGGKITEYQVNMVVTFVLDDSDTVDKG